MQTRQVEKKQNKEVQTKIKEIIYNNLYDTTFIGSTNVNDVSEFDLDTLPPETANIKGVYIRLMGKLIAAGVGAVQVSLVSNSEVSLGPEITLTTTYSYFGGVHELDPDTELPWTKEGLEAAILRVEKTI